MKTLGLINRTKKLDGKSKRKFYIVCISIFTIMSVVFLVLGSNFKIQRKVTYSEKGNLDYKVYLKENSFFKEPYVGKDKKIVASLIDHINIDYNYKFQSDHYMDFKCKYYVWATSTVSDKGNEKKLIYQDEKYVTEEKIKEENSCKEISIQENVNINYDEFNNLIKSFTSLYSLEGTENALEIELCVNMEGSSNGFKNMILDESYVSFKIPLTDKTVDANIDYKEIDDNGEKIDISDNKILNVLFYIIAIIFIFLDMLSALKLIKKFEDKKKEQSKYEKDKNRILYQYNRAISKIIKPVDIAKHEIIELETIIDLINVRDCLDKPIIFFENEIKKTSWFMVTDEKIIYRFILNDNDKFNGNKNEKI